MASIRRFLAEPTSKSASTAAWTPGRLLNMKPRVLFDEVHSEAWTIRPELAQSMQPAHPADASYAKAAGALSDEAFLVQPNVDAPLSAALLQEWDVLVIAHPSDPTWERTTGLGSPVLDSPEIEAIVA